MAKPKQASYCCYGRFHTILQLVLFFLILSLKSGIGATETECLRCDDLNRESKPDVVCAKNYDDCGDCQSGFVNDPDDNRNCIQIEILEISNNKITKTLSENVYLECKFNTKIDCQWTKDGKTIKLSGEGPYKWTRNSDGSDTEDCSINIVSLAYEDAGQWICSNKANSNVNTVKSRPITITAINSKILAEPENDYTAETGDSVELKCQFDQPGRCNWIKNKIPVQSHQRYQFTSENTEDCSLTIQQFDPCKDVGTWQCQRPGDSENEAIVSKITNIFSATNTDCNVMNSKESGVTIKRNPREPKIVLNDYDITRINVDFTPGTDDQMILDISCVTAKKPSRMSWLIHGDAEYPGAYLDGNYRATEELKNSIIEHLKVKKYLKVLCLVEYHDLETHSASVIFVRDDEDVSERVSVAFSHVLIAIYVLLVMVIVGFIFVIGAAVCCLCCNNKPSEHQNKYWHVMKSHCQILSNIFTATKYSKCESQSITSPIIDHPHGSA